jgi:hypothetical protein
MEPRRESELQTMDIYCFHIILDKGRQTCASAASLEQCRFNAIALLGEIPESALQQINLVDYPDRNPKEQADQ